MANLRLILKTTALAIFALYSLELFATQTIKAPSLEETCNEASPKIAANSWPFHFTGYGEALEFDKAKSAALTDLMAYFGVEIDSNRVYLDRTASDGMSSSDLEDKTTNRVQSFLLGAEALYSCRSLDGWRIVAGVRKTNAQKMFRDDLEEKITDARSFLRRLEQTSPKETSRKVVASSIRKSLLDSKAMFELASGSKSSNTLGKEELKLLSDYLGQSEVNVLRVTSSDDLSKNTFVDLANLMGLRQIWLEPAKTDEETDAVWRCTIDYAPEFSGVQIFHGRCDLALKGTSTSKSIYQVIFEGIASYNKPDEAVTSACKSVMRK